MKARLKILRMNRYEKKHADNQTVPTAYLCVPNGSVLFAAPEHYIFSLMQLVKDYSEWYSPDLDSFSTKLQGFKAKYYPSGFKPNTKWIQEHLPEIHKVSQKLLPKNAMGVLIYTKEATELDTVAFIWIMRRCKRYLRDGLTTEAEKNLFDCVLRVKALYNNNY